MVQSINNNNNINYNQFKEGVKKTELKSEKEKFIFDKLDKNKDGKLSKTELDNLVDGKVKNTKGELVTKKYVKIKSLPQGRSLVQDNNGKEWVMAHDGTILKSNYGAKVTNGAVKDDTKPQPKTASQQTISNLNKQLKTASTSFNKQLADDGWAGDVADGVSALWGSKNRASKVREDIATQRNNINELTNASQKGEEAFKIKFKQIYGVEYNQQAIENYNKKPTPENYKKAFGTRVPDISLRVKEYNESQQTGATAVKTTAKVAGGVVVGVATGGAGFVALGAAAVGTAATSVIVDETDRANITGSHTDANGKTVKAKGAFKEGTNHAQILKDAAWDGASVVAGGAVGKVAGATIKGATKMATAGRAATNVAGDTALGAAREYAETGEVTTTGILSNAATSGVGSAVTSGALKVGGKVFSGIKRGLSNANNSTTTTTQSKQYKVKARTPKSSSATSSTKVNQGIVIVNKRARSTTTTQASTPRTTKTQVQQHTTSIQKTEAQQTQKKKVLSFDSPKPKAKTTETKTTASRETRMSDTELIESLDFKNPENTIATRKALRELESRGYKLDKQDNGYLVKDGQSVPILTKEQKTKYKNIQDERQRLSKQKEQIQSKMDELANQVKTIKSNQQRLETLDQAIAIRNREVRGLKSSIRNNGEPNFNGKLNRGKAILKMVEEDYKNVSNYRSLGDSSLEKRINDKFGIKTGNNYGNVKYSYIDDNGKKVSLDGNTPIKDELLDLVHAYQNNSTQNRAKILQKMRDYVSKMETDMNRPQRLLAQREQELQNLTKERDSLKMQMAQSKTSDDKIIEEYNNLSKQIQNLTTQVDALPKIPTAISRYLN